MTLVPAQARFMSLLGAAFRQMPPALALSILDPKISFSDEETQGGVQEAAPMVKADGTPLTPYDLKRLQVGACLAPAALPLRVTECDTNVSGM